MGGMEAIHESISFIALQCNNNEQCFSEDKCLEKAQSNPIRLRSFFIYFSIFDALREVVNFANIGWRRIDLCSWNRVIRLFSYVIFMRSFRYIYLLRLVDKCNNSDLHTLCGLVVKKFQMRQPSEININIYGGGKCRIAKGLCRN